MNILFLYAIVLLNFVGVMSSECNCNCDCEPKVTVKTHKRNAARYNEKNPHKPERKPYCKPGYECWPDASQITHFNNQLTGDVILPANERFGNASQMENHYFQEKPAIIALVKTEHDVIASIRFARKFNIQIIIKSCGHDGSGRSTGKDSLQINFLDMNMASVDLSDSRSPTGASMTTQPGAKWISLYTMLDGYGKRATGGTCPTVCPAGYTMGAGISMLSRERGLSVDNVIEFNIVLYDGVVATCNKHGTTYRTRNKDGHVDVRHSDDKSLFWAVRGGGGGTFGVVTSFTFVIYDAAEGMFQMNVYYPLMNNGSSEIGKRVIAFLLDFVPTLPDPWRTGVTVSDDGFFPTIEGPAIHAEFTHNGPLNDAARAEIQAVLDFETDFQVGLTFSEYDTYFDYLNSIPPWPPLTYVISNAMLELPVADQDRLVKFIAVDSAVPAVAEGSLTYTSLIFTGGQIKRVPTESASVSYAVRHADVWLTASEYIVDASVPNIRKLVEKNVEMWDRELATFGGGGYVNEGGLDAINWKHRFWGENYERLVEIDKKVDPLGVFHCHQCIGDA